MCVYLRANAASADRMRSITPTQSPGLRCRNKRIVGYQGVSSRSNIQRQSGWADNEELSVARANTVMSYLVEKRGIDSARLTASGYGEGRPIADNSTAAGRQKNRRVEIVILP